MTVFFIPIAVVGTVLEIGRLFFMLGEYKLYYKSELIRPIIEIVLIWFAFFILVLCEVH